MIIIKYTYYILNTLIRKVMRLQHLILVMALYVAIFLINITLARKMCVYLLKINSNQITLLER